MSFIETDRLLIRKWESARDPDDAAAFYGDAQTMRFIPCGALDRQQIQSLIARMIEHDERDGFGIWPAVHKGDRRIIGECGITYIPGYGQDVEMGWILDRRYQGHGYALEAAQAVIDFAFSELRLPQLYALIDRENAPSIRLANRLGMRYERITRAYKRDLMRYTLLAASRRA